MMGTRRPMARTPSGNGRYYDSHGSSNGNTSDSEDSNGSVYTPRADSRSYLLNVRPENRTTFCNIISQLTEETQPCFETTLKARAVSEGSDAKLTCIVSGHPEPEVTWYKDDEEMDRYCGLPKYEIFRNGKRHTLQIYKCSEEDAAIYQASARNNKGIVSCSGVLEVGTMTEYKIHQRWFAKLKRKAEAKMREIEQSRRRVKENLDESEKLRALSPERIQRKRRFSFEKTEDAIKSSMDEEESIKVHITDPNSRLQEEMPKTTEQAHSMVNGFANIDTQQKEEVTTNGFAVPEGIEENGKEFLTYVYETVDAITKKASSKESYAKKKKKEEEPPLPTSDSKEETIQGSPKKVEGISPAPRRSRFGKETPKTPVEEKMEIETSPVTFNKRFAPSTGPSKTVKPIVTKDIVKLKDSAVAIKKGEESSILKPVQTKGDLHFSLKEMYFGDSLQHPKEEKSTPEFTPSKLSSDGQTKDMPKAAPRRPKEQRELSAGHKPPGTKPEAPLTGTISNAKGQNMLEVKPKPELPKVSVLERNPDSTASVQAPVCNVAEQKAKEVKEPDQVSKVPKISSGPTSLHGNRNKPKSLEGNSTQAHEARALENNRVSSADPNEDKTRQETIQKLEKLETEYMALKKAYALLQQQLELSQKAEALKAEAQRAEALKAEAQRAEAIKAEALRAEAMKAETQRAEALKAEAQRAEALKAEAQRAEAMKAEAQRTEALKAEAQRAEAIKAEAQRAEAIKAEAQRAEALKAEALRAEAMKAEAQRAEAMKAEAQRVEALKAEALRAEAMKAEAQRAEALKAEALRAEATKAEAQRAEAMKAEAQRAEALKAEAQRVEALKAEAQRAEALKAEAQRKEALKKEAQRAEAQRAEAQRAEALKAEAKRAEAMKAEAQRVEAMKAEAQRVEAMKEEAQRAEAQRAEAIKAEAQRVEALKAEAQRANALKAEAQRPDTIKALTLKEESNRAEAQNAATQRAKAQKVCPSSPEPIYMETEELTKADETPSLGPVCDNQQSKTLQKLAQISDGEELPYKAIHADDKPTLEDKSGTSHILEEVSKTDDLSLRPDKLSAQVNIPETSKNVQDIDLSAESPSELSSNDQNQSVVTLLRDVKKALESAVIKEESSVDPVSVQPQAEYHDGADVILSENKEIYDQESGQPKSQCTNLKDMESATNSPSSESNAQETAQDSASKPQDKQDHGLVTTLKNSLLMLFHIKPTDSEPKSERNLTETPSESPEDIYSPERSPPRTHKVYESGKESDSPQSPVSMHSTSSSGKLTPASEEDMVQSAESVTTSPTFPRRAIDFKKKGDISQAESAPQSPVTPKKSLKSSNEGILLTKEDLSFSPATSRKIAAKIAGADFPTTFSVPSIVVGDLPPDKTLESTLKESQTDGSRKWRSSENLSAIPSATPEELASGARRKIYLTKPKQVDNEDDDTVGSLNSPSRKDSPNVSPGLSRRSNSLLVSQSPPVERRSPGTSRRAAKLEVPKISEETVDQEKGSDESSKEAKDPSAILKEEKQSVESRKINDPYKAPQVIRKIRAEQFSDASGNLKLWCQFFNILSDSDITWYKDEVQMAKVKRCAADEGQVALAIVQASVKDCGVYQCSIENEYGTDSTDCLLSAEILAGFINKEEVEVGEEIEMTPMVFAKGLADSGYWGDKYFGRIVMEEPHVGKGFIRKSCRVKVIYGLEPMFESGKTCIIKIRNLITFGTKNENTLVEKNYDITIQECKTQNTTREYCKIFAAECRGVLNFGQIIEILPLNLIYRPANNIPYATIEEDLVGRFEKYCLRDIAGKLHMKNTSEIEQKCCTFQHWVYQWTNGNFLVTTLEGVEWKITNIAIATKSKGYQGLKESCCPEIIEEFTSIHQCNSYCEMLGLKSLKTMESLQPPAKPKGSRSPQMARKTGSTSAQSSPQTQKKVLTVPQNTKKGSVSPKSARKSLETGDSVPGSKSKGNDVKLQ